MPVKNREPLLILPQPYISHGVSLIIKYDIIHIIINIITFVIIVTLNVKSTVIGNRDCIMWQLQHQYELQKLKDSCNSCIFLGIQGFLSADLKFI